MPAKLTPEARADIMNTVQRRRAYTRLITKLIAERAALPNHKELARAYGVHYSSVARTVYGRS